MEVINHGRYVIGKGMEHIVLQPKRKELSEWGLVKIPRLQAVLSLWPYEPLQVLRAELREAQVLVVGTKVKIPRTYIHKTRSGWPGSLFPGYVIRQELIKEDGSVPNIRDVLIQENLHTLAAEHGHEEGNFKSKDGFVYWIDPTKGPAGRILENVGIMNLENWRKLRLLLHTPIRSVGL
ncbi:MAG: hypothetical protein PHQ59_03950 [Candidatus Daviesbacteria bacterium]|nr:hypothetical protein [Candidatus Daviesbacteria bacterium]